MLAAGAAEAEWGAGLCAALRVLGDEVDSHPLRMRGLLVEVHVAGGEPLERRAETLERLSRAADRARLEMEPGQLEPPLLAATFMVRAVDGAVTRALLDGRPRDFTSALPDLAQMVASPYLGPAGGRSGEANGPKELGILLRAAMLA
jgi:hypothetical protein